MLRLAVALVLLALAPARAQEAEMEDKPEGFCTDPPGLSDAERMACARTALAEVQSDLEYVLPLLLRRVEIGVDPRTARSNVAKVRDSQRAWLAWLEAECRAFADVTKPVEEQAYWRLECRHRLMRDRLRMIRDSYFR